MVCHIEEDEAVASGSIDLIEFSLGNDKMTFDHVKLNALNEESNWIVI